jgi:hypothetical protein
MTVASKYWDDYGMNSGTWSTAEWWLVMGDRQLPPHQLTRIGCHAL